ncbi:hypothetical protein FB567DRAFT_122705 [Paraphoma chrysanthemicola]|uniref:tRNA-splicing endonuclease subunit Sen2 n=1 Tax=Paraphoma chrysanthemicola TaxID=798071 RepID=A0A8K0VVV2_9PLEO|nr:hypothetical protein FB567DRAFT_122705 [Paraphoma chrysanthemicola]
MAADVEAQNGGHDVNSKGASAPPQGSDANGAPKKPRPRRPNYHEIHVKPIPLDIYPLPAFIPHNPISIVRIVLALLSHSLFPPKSHVVAHRAYFSAETQSIHVTDAASIRALWEQGFWGKGSLSRSEPQWLTGEKKKRGIEASKTSAEVTQNRREERRQFKLERARAQREAIEQQLRQEGKLDADGSIEELVDDGQISESPRGTIYTPDAGDVVTVKGDSIVSEIDKSLKESAPSWDEAEPMRSEAVEIKDQEHLQLTPEEAFYLTYSFGALSVATVTEGETEGSPVSYPSWFLFRLYAAYAGFPVPEALISNLQSAYQIHNDGRGSVSDISRIEPDNQFILRYVVYHHFRSLGWVVRPGIKFAVDYLLYLRGPAFHHAEFAIMIIPSYSDLYWTQAPESETKLECRQRELRRKDWWWLHRVNRVQSAVFKTLVLVYVEVPPPWDVKASSESGLKVDIGNVLKQYKVREVVIKRWSPNRNRD